MKIKHIFFFLFVILSFFSVNAQCDLNFAFENTGSNMTVLYASSASTSLSYTSDQGTIGAFYQNSDGAYHCASAMSFNGSQTQLPLMADDSTTPQKDGFSNGDVIHWFYKDVLGAVYKIETFPADVFLLNSISIIETVELEEIDCGTPNSDSCEPLNYSYSNTGLNMTLALPYSAINSLNDLGEGMIGVFYYNESGALTCSGSTSISDIETAFPAMGNDQTTEQIDGFLEGQDMIWIFTSSSGIQYQLFPTLNEYFSVNAIYYVSEFDYILNCSSDQEILGCTDSNACNYNPYASDDDGSCYNNDLGCGCDAPVAADGFDCIGNCLNDIDGDGVCDEFEVRGCTDYSACNYDSQATDDDGSCYNNDLGCGCDSPAAVEGYDCYGNCLNDSDVDGICDDDEVFGCTNDDACNFNISATNDDGSCTFAQEATNYNLSVNPANGWGDNYSISSNRIVHIDDSNDLACDDLNLDLDGAIALILRGGCQFSLKALNAQNAGASAVIIYNNFGGIINMAPGNNNNAELIEIPVYSMSGQDGSDIAAWLLSSIVYNATLENQILNITTPAYDCEGNCINDSDSDGICDEDETLGCIDAAACNYDLDATDDDGSCYNNDLGCGCDEPAANDGYDCEGNCVNDSDSDGICDEDELLGCIDAAACNYDSDATDDDDSCSYSDAGYDCAGVCLADIDQDGICDEFEVLGCTELSANNFNPNATDDDGSCEFTPTIDPCLSVNYDFINTGSNMTLIFPFSSIEFIQDLGVGNLGVFYSNSNGDLICSGSTFMNGEETAFPVMGDDATTEELDGLETNQDLLWIYTVSSGEQYYLNSFPTQTYVTNGIYYIDYFEYELINCTDVLGCTDSGANNYSTEANVDDGSCAYDVLGCTDSGANNYSSDANLDDGSCAYDVLGCTDSGANNYSSDANLDNGSCAYDVLGCTDSGANNYSSDANLDDGSCAYDVLGCTDSSANNYSTEANVDDGSCNFSTDCGCTNSEYIEFYTQGFIAGCDDGSCSILTQSLGITNNHFNTPLNTSVNMTLGLDFIGLSIPEGTIVGAFYDVNNDGEINSNPMIGSENQIYYECVGLAMYQNEFFAMAIWGDDQLNEEIDGVPSNSDGIVFAMLLPDQSVLVFDLGENNFVFEPNALIAVNTVNLDVTVYGCTDESYCNFNSYADQDDGSCEGSHGCMQEMYVNYDSSASCHSNDLCYDTWHDHYVLTQEVYDNLMSSFDSSYQVNQILSLALDEQINLSETLVNELSNANVLINDYQNQIQNLSDEVSNLTLDLEFENSNNSALQTQVDASNLLIIDLQNEISSLQSDFQIANANNISIQTQLDASNVLVTDLQNQISSLGSDLDLVNSNNSSLQTQLDASNVLITDLQNQNSSISSELDIANANNSSLQTQLDASNVSMTDLQNQMSSLESELELANSNSSSFQIQLNASNILIIDLQNQNSSMSSELDLANSNSSALQIELDTSNLLITDLQNQISSLGLDLDLVNSNNNSLQTQLDASNVLITDLQNQNSSISSELDLANTNNSSLQIQLNSSNVLVANLENSSSELNSELNFVNDSLVYQSNLIEDQLLVISNLESQISDLNSENILLANESLTNPIMIDLLSGWNIIGYTLKNQQDAVISFDGIVDILSVAKNNNGDVYWPEFGYNGIGDLIPGQGYQVRMDESYDDFIFVDHNGLRIEIQPTVPQWAIDMNVFIHPNDIRTLVRIVNSIGQEVNPNEVFKGSLLYYLYNDGTVEKMVK